MARIRDWLHAARPLAQANIAVPLLFGQAVAWASHRAFAWRWVSVLVLFGVLDQLYIVFANDYADRESDGQERTPFSGGSGVLQSGAIEPLALRRAAITSAIALVALSACFAADRPYLLVFAGAAIALLHAYSFPPLRLSFRGGGEWLQALGVGALLPLVGFYTQSGRLDLPAWALAPAFLAGLAGNVMTAVPDVDTDTRTGK
ncbi:MAG: prenyltransferase, partial [Polyangiaceae bacterium]|nr:prenyltransferase [Polyangiaceae bacterium]